MRSIKIKNQRRLNFVTSEDGKEYFSEEMMKMRDPLLYEDLVGRFDKRLNKHSQTTVERLCDDLDEFEFLKVLNEAKRLRDDHEQEFEYDDEYMLYQTKEQNEIVSMEQVNNHKKEFMRLMTERFLGGLDHEFMYDKVDLNVAYDDLNVIGQDEQDAYFDLESEDGPNLRLDEYDY